MTAGFDQLAQDLERELRRSAGAEGSAITARNGRRLSKAESDDLRALALGRLVELNARALALKGERDFWMRFVPVLGDNEVWEVLSRGDLVVRVLDEAFPSGARFNRSVVTPAQTEELCATAVIEHARAAAELTAARAAGKGERAAEARCRYWWTLLDPVPPGHVRIRGQDGGFRIQPLPPARQEQA